MSEHEEDQGGEFSALTGAFVLAGLLLAFFGWLRATQKSTELELPARSAPFQVRSTPTTAGLLSVSPTQSPSSRISLARRSPVPSPTSLDRPSLDRLINAVQQDEVCTVMPAVYEDPIRIALALPEFMDLSPDAQMILRSVSPMPPADLANVFSEARSDWAEYYEALMSADLTTGASAPRNLERSRGILEDLAARYPDNGVFAYYLMSVLKKMGAPPEAMDPLIEAFTRASTFDDGSRQVYLEILRGYSVNVSGYAVALAAIATLPAPDMGPSRQILFQRMNDRPDFAPAVYEAAERFLEEEVRLSTGLEFIEWSALEVAVFRSLTKAAWTRFNTGPIPSPTAIGGAPFESYRDLMNQPADPELEALHELLKNAHLPGSCREDQIRGAYSALAAS